MPAYSFFTVKAPAEGMYREKGSKFLAFAYPVKDEMEIREHLGVLKKKYFDARHHCFAWILGPDKDRSMAFDDGEPNHSAGDPILGQIRSKGLTNVLVVVVRYFGGVKLGVGGLVSAYKTAAEDALSNAYVVEKEVVGRISLQYDYAATAEIMRLVKEFDLTVVLQDFTDICRMNIEVRLKVKEAFFEKIKLLQAMGLAISLGENEH